ncbi:hypothetical protein C0J52_09080 [Blattella germanica]|nr:hypothetical protein C0J52_09080 [Blattella germanica]
MARSARGTKRAKQSQQARVTDAPPPPKEQRPDRPRQEGRNSRRGENLKPPSPPKSQTYTQINKKWFDITWRKDKEGAGKPNTYQYQLAKQNQAKIAIPQLKK